jgi:hypothetical protein
MQSPSSHLKNTWRFFICLLWTLIKYLPFGIKFFVIQKQWSLLLKKYGYLQGKQNYSFSFFTSMFYQRFTEHRFLESTLELLQQFYLQVESIALDYKVFPRDQSKFSLNCIRCGKKNYSYRINWESFIHGTHGYFSSSENVFINPFCQWFMFNFQEYASPFHIHENYSASKTLIDEAIYEIAEDEADVLFHSKYICTNHDCRIGEYCFCEATKVDLAESGDTR